MSRRNIQQPRAPGSARKVVMLDRRVQAPREPSDGQLFQDLRINFNLGYPGTIVPTGTLPINLGGTAADNGTGALNNLANPQAGDVGKVLTVETGTLDMVLATPAGGAGNTYFPSGW